MTTLFQARPTARLIGACLTLTASLAIAGAAAAQPTDYDTAPTVHVNYSDLNLRSQEGAQAMVSRINSAAIRACGGEPDIRVLDRRAFFNQCKSQKTQLALRDLDAPMVTAQAGQSAATVFLAGR